MTQAVFGISDACKMARERDTTHLLYYTIPLLLLLLLLPLYDDYYAGGMTGGVGGEWGGEITSVRFDETRGRRRGGGSGKGTGRVWEKGVGRPYCTIRNHNTRLVILEY